MASAGVAKQSPERPLTIVPPVPAEFGPLVPIKNFNNYIRPYYVIQNYRDVFGGDKTLAVSYSTIPNAGLGLFAISEYLATHAPDPDIDYSKVIPAGGGIDEYKGERIEHFEPDVIKYFIQKSHSKYLYEVVPNHVVIDATDM